MKSRIINHTTLNLFLICIIFPMVTFAIDVYVSTSGNDSNSGTSWEDAYKTIHFALINTTGSSSDPAVIHIASGEYSPSSTGETYPLSPTSDYVTLEGISSMTTLLNAQNNPGVFMSDNYSNLLIQNLSITGGMGYSGSGISISRCSSAIINQCIIAGNSSYVGGGCNFTYSTGTVLNTQLFSNTAVSAGGAINSSSLSTVEVKNCLIYSNIAGSTGAGLYCDSSSDLLVLSSSLYGNSATSIGGGLYFAGRNFSVDNSIFWGNHPDELSGSFFDGAVNFSDVPNSIIGSGNFYLDPLFIDSGSGNFRLSQIHADQSEDSPCKDAGRDPAQDTCFSIPSGIECMSDFTTRTDEIADNGSVDVGYHYQIPTPTPTPIPPTNTPTQPTGTPGTPTSTPTNPTGTPGTPTRSPTPGTPTIPPTFTPSTGCSELGCEIHVPSTTVYPGYAFFCDLHVCNPTVSYTNVPVFVLLEISGTFFFAPSFDGFDHYTMDIPAGYNEIKSVIPPFTWPHAGNGEATWYAAMTDESITEIIGAWDSVDFRWRS
jgi:hypothetical protein